MAGLFAIRFEKGVEKTGLVTPTQHEESRDLTALRLSALSSACPLQYLLSLTFRGERERERGWAGLELT